VWLTVRGLSFKMTQRPEFRNYVRGYDPCAAFPHSYTVDRIALCIDELQTIERKARIASLKKQFKNKPCIGLQLDMWTDSDTHTAYGCVTMTTVDEPRSRSEDPAADPEQLWVKSEIIDFDVFPNTSKTGENIKKW
jgi:hypothetical protein